MDNRPVNLSKSKPRVRPSVLFVNHRRSPATGISPPPPSPVPARVASQTSPLADRQLPATDGGVPSGDGVSDPSDSSRIPPPGYSDYPSGETDSRREARRWCFTLNNPCETDMYAPDQPIKSDIYDYLLVAKEKGKNGTPHLQGFIIFTEKRRLSWIIKNIFVSSVTGKGRASWFLCGGNILQNQIYCKKGDQPKEEWLKYKEKGPNYGLNADFVEFGEAPKEGRGPGKASRDTVFSEALALGTSSAALKYLSENAPRDYTLQRHTLTKNLAEHFKPEVHYKPLYALEEFCHVPLHFSDKHATLVWGGSGLGKTAFVKAHFKNPLFVTHIDNLKSFQSSTHDAIIFDDLSFRHMPPETVIHLLETDNEASIHVRYGVAHIPARVVKVFTHNTANPFYNETVNEDQQKAIERRFKAFHVCTKLFK